MFQTKYILRSNGFAQFTGRFLRDKNSCINSLPVEVFFIIQQCFSIDLGNLLPFKIYFFRLGFFFHDQNRDITKKTIIDQEMQGFSGILAETNYRNRFSPKTEFYADPSGVKSQNWNQ